ncbi:hypothetical protein WAI453_010836 [Rhynchosporium graminicola]
MKFLVNAWAAITTFADVMGLTLNHKEKLELFAFRKSQRLLASIPLSPLVKSDGIFSS